VDASVPKLSTVVPLDVVQGLGHRFHRHVLPQHTSADELEPIDGESTGHYEQVLEKLQHWKAPRQAVYLILSGKHVLVDVEKCIVVGALRHVLP
jgi:hypothetical protein